MVCKTSEQHVLECRINTIKALETLCSQRHRLNRHVRVTLYNHLSTLLFKLLGYDHPILNVQIVALDNIKANSYNPNQMASPEFKLLMHSIESDGLTMPVVVSEPDEQGQYTIIDGFHRIELFKRNQALSDGTDGYIPAVILDRSFDKRISSSVRHNIARGVHQVELTAKLVMDLKSMDWSDEKISAELGMDADEVLRMQQITGLTAAFHDQAFSRAWD